MNALRELLHKLTDGAPLSGDDIIALALLLTMVASLAHLLTMLVTRWGDQNIALKSLLASILIHGVCILGLEVFEPLALRKATANELPLEPPEVLTEVLVESDQNVKLPESGNNRAATFCRHLSGDYSTQTSRSHARQTGITDNCG